MKLALFAHLLGALLLASGTTVAGVAFESARRRRAPHDVWLLLRLARVGVAFVAVGTVLLLVSGLRLVDLGSWGYGSGWIVAALVLLGLTMLLGGLGGRRPRHARVLAEQLDTDGDDATDELRALLDDPLSRLANYASAALLVVILVVMVWKPGA